MQSGQPILEIGGELLQDRMLAQTVTAKHALLVMPINAILTTMFVIKQMHTTVQQLAAETAKGIMEYPAQDITE